MIRGERDTATVEGRTAAVARAKQLSARTWATIVLESVDGRVKMQFQRGALLSYRREAVERR